MQSFIGLVLMVHEIIRGSLKTPLGPLNGKKPGLNRVKIALSLPVLKIFQIFILFPHFTNNF